MNKVLPIMLIIMSVLLFPLLLNNVYAVVIPVIIPMNNNYNNAPNGYTCTQINKTSQQCVPIPLTQEQEKNNEYNAILLLMPFILAACAIVFVIWRFL